MSNCPVVGIKSKGYKVSLERQARVAYEVLCRPREDFKKYTPPYDTCITYICIYISIYIITTYPYLHPYSSLCIAISIWTKTAL